MNVEQLESITVPILRSFPHGRLLFDERKLFLENYTFDGNESWEFKELNSTI